MSDHLHLIAHMVMALVGITAVVLMTAWHDISGTVAIAVILALTSATGAQSLAAATTPTAVAKLIAEGRTSSSGMGQGR